MSNTEAVSLLHLFETTKEQRQSFVAQVLDNVKEGNVNPLNVHLQVKCMEEMIKAIKDSKDYKELLLEEAEKHGKNFVYRSGKIQVKEAGTTFDYSVCQDPEYIELLSAFEKASAALKEREAFLKGLPEGGLQVVNEETGETYKIYKPLRSSTTSVSVTLI